MITEEQYQNEQIGQVFLALNRYQVAIVERDSEIAAAHERFNAKVERMKKINISCKLQDRNGRFAWEAGYVRPVGLEM
jgi:hypothetical protein